MIAVLLLSGCRALLLACGFGLLLSLFRVQHPAVRKISWTVVLLFAFAMPLLGPHMQGLDLSRHFTSVAGEGSPPLPTRIHSGAIILSKAVRAVDPGPGKGRLLGALYATLTIALLTRIAFGLAIAYRLWSTASPAPQLGSSVRLSKKVNSPWTFGFGVVLPLGAEHWPENVQRTVLAHEYSHVHSADFFLQLLARVYTALFWWSPLGWWAQKELARLAEQTSDHAALLTTRDPAAYAELLVKFSSASVPRSAIAMARPLTLQTRLDYVLSRGEFMNRFSAPFRSCVTAAASLCVSLVLATVTIPAAALGTDAEHLVGTVTTTQRSGVDGFACTLDNGITAVGLRASSGARVSVGTFTEKHVSRIRAAVGDLFIAFHRDGQDYVITDPELVRQGLGFFATEASMKAESQESASQPPTTEREAKQQAQIEELRAKLAVLQGQRTSSLAAVAPMPKDANKRLQALIESAQRNGKARRLTV